MAYTHNPKSLTELHRRIYESIYNGSKMTIYKVHRETGIVPSTVANYIHFFKDKGLVEAVSISGKSRFYYIPTDMTFEELEQALYDEYDTEKSPDVLLEKMSTFTLTKQEYEFYKANKARLQRSKIAKALRLSKLELNAGIENYEKKMKGSN